MDAINAQPITTLLNLFMDASEPILLGVTSQRTGPAEAARYL